MYKILKFLTLSFFFSLLLIAGKKAKADDLLTFSCVTVENFGKQTIGIWKNSSFGLSCESLKSSKEAVELVSAALLPVSVALNASPQVRNALMTDLAAMGLTLANPAVLTATVIGSVGVATFYIIVRKSFQECAEFEKAALKEAIINELQRQYNFKATNQVPFEIYNQKFL
ncbi:MAG: hypothetical protein ACXVCP_15950 [Bdellovibrio sp.]